MIKSLRVGSETNYKLVISETCKIETSRRERWWWVLRGVELGIISIGGWVVSHGLTKFTIVYHIAISKNSSFLMWPKIDKTVSI